MLDSRARSLAIVVGCPALLVARCQSIREMELVNLFCWLVDYSQRPAGQWPTESDTGESLQRPRNPEKLAESLERAHSSRSTKQPRRRTR